MSLLLCPLAPYEFQAQNGATINTTLLNCVAMSAQVAYSSARPLNRRYKSRINVGIKAEASKWRIKLPKDVDFSTHIFQGEKTTRLGNRPIAPNTSLLYEEQFRQFFRYCALRGEYQPLLLLLVPSIPNAPSMDVEVVESFGRFKRLQPNAPLMSTDGSEQLKDAFGNPFTADGGWNAPKQVEHFKAAISNIHVANDLGGQYVEHCDACRALPARQRHKGCIIHSGDPRLIRKGNPAEHQTFLNMKTSMMKVAADEGYEENGSSQLLPSDLRLLRTHLLSSGSIIALQTWVIIIVSVKQALRHDDAYDMNLEHFLPALFEVQQTGIAALGVEVNGKADQKWIKQKLFADDEYPDLCPVRPLLVYMHLIGIKGGYLFPSANEILNECPANGIYKTTYEYQGFLKSFKELCHRVLPPREGLKVGCQTFRKTFYVLAVFGGGEESDVQMSARHKSQDQSLKYRKDAKMLLDTHKQHPNPANNVSKWKAIHVDGSGGNAAILTALAGYTAISPSLVPDYFVRDILGVSETNPLAKQIPYLIDVAMKHGMNLDPDREIEKWIAENVHPDKADQLASLIGKVVRKHVENIVNTSDENNNLLLARSVAAIPVPTVEATTFMNEPSSKKRKASAEKNDLSDRHSLNTLDTAREKVEMMVTLWETKPTWATPLTPGAKSFVIKFLTPAMNCLAKHFSGDVSSFVEKYQDFKHTTFPTKCCNGKGTSCGVEK